MEIQTIATRQILKAAIVAGVIAGTIDVGVAALINLISPTLILKAIASGLLGLAAYKATWTLGLGFALQIAMSVVIAGIYAAAATRLAGLRERPFIAGGAYGVVVFVAMNFIVVPLSAFAPRPAHVSISWLLLNFAAMLLFGIIVAVSVATSFGVSPRFFTPADNPS